MALVPPVAASKLREANHLSVWLIWFLTGQFEVTRSKNTSILTPAHIPMTHGRPTSRQVSSRLTLHPPEPKHAVSRAEQISGVADMDRVHSEARIRTTAHMDVSITSYSFTDIATVYARIC